MGNRSVKIGIVPESPTQSRVGVAIIDGSEKIVVTPDEARTFAELEEDHEIARRLREVAQKVETILADPRVKETKLAPPKLTGEEGLKYWTQRHNALIRSCYRTAVGIGYPPDVIVRVMPPTESLDDPPLSAALFRPSEARTGTTSNNRGEGASP